MMPLLRSLRPVQWVKNLIVFAGLIFSRHFDQSDDVLRSLGVFGVFCAMIALARSDTSAASEHASLPEAA